jgi:hypothetical protein
MSVMLPRSDTGPTYGVPICGPILRRLQKSRLCKDCQSCTPDSVVAELFFQLCKTLKTIAWSCMTNGYKYSPSRSLNFLSNARPELLTLPGQTVQTPGVVGVVSELKECTVVWKWTQRVKAADIIEELFQGRVCSMLHDPMTDHGCLLGVFADFSGGAFRSRFSHRY